jgi:CRISPR-associated endonuclease Csy4
MNVYQEITLFPNEEIPTYFLWEKLYQQLHFALVEVKQPDEGVPVGVSFPDFNKQFNHLGCKLRIFAKEKLELKNLNITEWLSRLKDYVTIADIENIPEKVERYACFKRCQPKINNARLARRMAKRKNISYELALSHFKSRTKQMSKLPFISLKSHSSDNRFRLFIEKKERVRPVPGLFNSYGLSNNTTVPWF